MKKDFRPQAVVWDMDGVIFDTEPLVLDYWDMTLTPLGYKEVRSIIGKCIGKNERDSDGILKAAFGEDFAIKGFRAGKRSWIDARIEKEGLRIKPGIVDALTWLENKKIPIAIASSSNKTLIVSLLKRANLEEYFHAIVGGNEVERGKPEPDIYLAAAKALRVDPASCIAIEDSEYGIRSAHTAGMQVIFIPDLVKATDVMLNSAHHHLSSGTEIVSLFVELFT